VKNSKGLVASTPKAQTTNADQEQSTHSSQGLSPYKLQEKLAYRAMKQFIASFRSSKSAPPPCRSYRNLICLSEFEEFFDRIRVAQTANELKLIRETMKPFKAAYNDLVGQCRNANSGLTRALEAAKKSAQKTKARSEKAKCKGNQSVNTNVFERAVEKGNPIPSIKISDFVPRDTIAEPVIIKDIDVSAIKESALGDAISKFDTKFKVSALRKIDGRAERPVRAGALEFASNFCNKVVLPDSVLSFDKMQPEMASHIPVICF
jgi:hypothetical protein